MSSTGGGIPTPPKAPVKKPSWLSNEAESIKAWGFAHPSYIVVAVIANLIGVLFHI